MSTPPVSDLLWEIVSPLLPPEPRKPKGGRPRSITDRAALTGINFVLKSGIPWEMLPHEMGCGRGMTCWRRLRDWQRADVWKRLHRALLQRLQDAGRIDWTLPRVRYPEQAGRWKGLVLLAYPQLRLARPLVSDQPLPWQRPQPVGKLTPERVQRAFAPLLVRLAILAFPPKPCGRSPGRPKGKRSRPAMRYPAITKALLRASHVA
jgi:transposase